MRGSLLAVLAIAVLAGLGSVIAIRNLGLLNPPTAAEPTKPAEPTPPPAVAPARPQVVVPLRVLYAGDTISPGETRLRDMTDNELKEFNALKDNRDKKDQDGKYRPDDEFIQVLEAVYFRTPAVDLPVDKPLRYRDLAEAKKPEALNSRLLPGTRAVDLYIMKENSAGGLIQVGDWVDVYVNTEVARTDAPGTTPYTGVLLQRAPVIAKRDTLYSIYAFLPDDKPIPYTIAANPYRAALIEYARNIGTLTLVPVSQIEKKKLDALREAAKNNPKPEHSVPFFEPGSSEFLAEMDRIDKITKGEIGVGTEDMVRLLGLPMIQPPAPVTPPPKPVTVEMISGVRKTGTMSFAPPEPPTPTLPAAPAARYIFSHPGNPAKGTGQQPGNGGGVTARPIPPRN